MTVDDLIRELSELSPADRRLRIEPVQGVFVFPGHKVALTSAECHGLPLLATHSLRRKP